jgi:hypothetical protein
MGELNERVNLSLLVYGDGIEDNFKNNSIYLADKYSKSSNMVKAIEISAIEPGTFYFFHYLDDSKWMMYSPVFVVSFTKFENKIILFAINFNFIPLEVRPVMFDEYLTIENFEKDLPIEVEYEKVYEELQKVGFEYSIVSYNAEQLKRVHRIHLDMLPRFLFSQHPMVKYDPAKLIEIWKKKLETNKKRDEEMKKLIISDLYNVRKDFSEKYTVLKKHIKRVQKSTKKYGGK